MIDIYKQAEDAHRALNRCEGRITTALHDINALSGAAKTMRRTYLPFMAGALRALVKELNEEADKVESLERASEEASAKVRAAMGSQP